MHAGPSVPEPTQPDAACRECALSSGFCVIHELLSQSLHSIQPGSCHSPASDGTGLQGLLNLSPKHFQAILASQGVQNLLLQEQQTGKKTLGTEVEN